MHPEYEQRAAPVVAAVAAAAEKATTVLAMMTAAPAAVAVEVAETIAWISTASTRVCPVWRRNPALLDLRMDEDKI